MTAVRAGRTIYKEKVCLFVYDQKVVDSMYGSHVVSMAVDYGVDLVKMWPLQTNQELENDVKYAENLQVMFSGMMTQVLLKRSEEVDQSVAEAVYEGMDVLPGVDPEIIRTLMDANRAYDVMASYHGVDGIELFMETARILGIDVGPESKRKSKTSWRTLTHYAQRLRIRKSTMTWRKTSASASRPRWTATNSQDATSPR